MMILVVMIVFVMLTMVSGDYYGGDLGGNCDNCAGDAREGACW